MIPKHPPWRLARGTIGKSPSSSRPSRYRGNCGPGTFVTTRLNARWRDCSRAAWLAIVGGGEAGGPGGGRHVGGDAVARRAVRVGGADADGDHPLQLELVGRVPAAAQVARQRAGD